jgi:hypothetical protein
VSPSIQAAVLQKKKTMDKKVLAGSHKDGQKHIEKFQ